MFEAVFVFGQTFLPKLFGDGRAGHAHDSFIVGTWRRYRIAGEQLPSPIAATDWRAGQGICAGLQPGQRSQHLRRQLGKSTNRFSSFTMALTALMQQLIIRTVSRSGSSKRRNVSQLSQNWFRSVHEEEAIYMLAPVMSCVAAKEMTNSSYAQETGPTNQAIMGCRQ